jgi:hypothetical protein
MGLEILAYNISSLFHLQLLLELLDVGLKAFRWWPWLKSKKSPCTRMIDAPTLFLMSTMFLDV